MSDLLLFFRSGGITGTIFIIFLILSVISMIASGKVSDIFKHLLALCIVYLLTIYDSLNIITNYAPSLQANICISSVPFLPSISKNAPSILCCIEFYAAFVRLAALYGKRGLIAKTRNGNPLLVGNVERTLKRVLQNLNFPEDGWYNVHALRHSFATALLAKGADIKKVSEILGHSSVQITYDYYIHFLPKDYADTVKLLDFS